jgi:hypothetical protein
MTNRLTISTGMCLDAPGQESLYTQMGANSSSPAFQAVYWKCLCVLFASSKRHNPDVRHLLFTNSAGAPSTPGFDIQSLLDRIGVETIKLPFTYAPPLDFYDRWRNTFYIFDIIRYFAESAADGEQFIINDTDCIYIKSASRLRAAIDQHHCLAYDVAYPHEKVINGHSRAGLVGLYSELGLPVSRPVEHYGAEILAIDAMALRTLMPELEALWQEMLRRHADGRAHFNTEEQFFSFLFTKLGYPPATANPHITRIWTGFKMNTATPSNFDLTTWHMPNEKRYGISRLFEQVKRPESSFWRVAAGDEFAHYVARFLAVPSPTPSKLLFDAIDRTMAKLMPAGATQ